MQITLTANTSASTIINQFHNHIVQQIISNTWLKEQVTKIYKNFNLDPQDGYQDIVYKLLTMSNKQSLIKAFEGGYLNWYLITFITNNRHWQLQIEQNRKKRENEYYTNRQFDSLEEEHNRKVEENIQIVKQLMDNYQNSGKRDYKWLLQTVYIKYIENEYNVAKTARDLGINRKTITDYITNYQFYLKHNFKKEKKKNG